MRACPPTNRCSIPGTQDAVKREDLQPLQVDPADYEMDFYGYEVKGEPRKYTLGDFKAAYDRMSVFERPKWGDMLGGIRQKITDEIDRALLNFDAEDRGLHQDPEVLAKVDEKIEEMLVSKLFEEGVHSDKTISPAALDSAWALLKGRLQPAGDALGQADPLRRCGPGGAGLQGPAGWRPLAQGAQYLRLR
jgi:hypothetical protein